METNSNNNRSRDDIETTVPLRNEDNAEGENYRDSKPSTCCECFREYSASTSIHGVQYLGEPNRPLWERLFWIVVFVISMYTCTHMIHKLWRKWNDTPVIVSFAERETEIWKIPFPAVTICPQMKSNPHVFKLEDAVKKPLENWTETEKKYGRALLNVCEIPAEYPELPIANETTEVDVIEVLQDAFFHIGATANFKGVEEDIGLIMTEDGICYNFNGLSMEDMYCDDCEVPIYNSSIPNANWDRENGYHTNAGLEAYPCRILGPGMKLGLDIFIPDVNFEVDNFCRLPPDGYKVLIHAPDNVPLISSKFFNVPAKHHVIAAVKPNMMWTSEELRNYSPEKRQCVFEGERKLKYFKRYTQVNCELECLTDFSFDDCECVKFSMPRFNNTRVCQTLKEIQCLNEIEELFLSAEVEFQYEKKANAKEAKDLCNCLPPCTTVVYSMETSQSSFDISKAAKTFQKDGEEDFSNLISATRLTVFFKEGSFLTSKRSELYGISEFVANCGGLLGLFMGFSALSFVEIFYFSVIRLITNYTRRERRRCCL